MSIVQAQNMDAMIGGDRSIPFEWFAGCSLAFGRVHCFLKSVYYKKFVMCNRNTLKTGCCCVGFVNYEMCFLLL